MSKQLICIAFFLLQFFSCVSQAPSERIEQTCKEVLNAIEELDTSKFISLIGRKNLRDISKTEEMVGFDVAKFKQLLDSNFRNGSPKYIFTNTYNSLGQQRVVVPIFTITEAGIERSLHLNLLFGPPDFISLDKLSGYSLVYNNSDSLDFKPLEYWNGNR